MKTSTKRLCVAALILHVVTTIVILLAGRLGLARGVFDVSGVGAFASDGVLYRAEAAWLADAMAAHGFTVWLDAPFQLHVKIYALLFTALGWCFGHTILSIEPLNALCYAAAVALVYRLGLDASGERAARLGAVIVGLWPSLLLHTTQFLKDPLVIVATLALVAVISGWLAREYSRRAGLAAWAVASLQPPLLWHLRREMLLVALAAVLLGLALLAVRQRRERRWLAGNMTCAVLLLFTTLLTPFVIPAYHTPPQLKKELRGRPPQAAQATTPSESSIQSRVLTMLGNVRRESSESADSAVDAHVEFRSPTDVLLYLPRAAQVGLFAPFPSQWFDEGGEVGRAGRLLSGAETLLTYALILSALLGVWGGRRRLSVYALLGVALIGVTGLGVAVANVGTLYRMRYPFWMLLVVLGAAGVVNVADRLNARRRAREGRASIGTSGPGRPRVFE